MKYTKKNATRIKGNFNDIPVELFDFWRKNNYLPEILLNKESVDSIDKTLVTDTLVTPWINKRSIEKAGVLRRSYFTQYKNDPCSLKNWVVAIIHSYFQEIDLDKLTKDEPLRFVEEYQDIIHKSTLGESLGYAGKTLGLFIQKKQYGFINRSYQERNEKIYYKLYGLFARYKEEILITV